MRRFITAAGVAVALTIPMSALTLGISGTAGAKKVSPVPSTGSHVTCAKFKLKIKSKTKKGKTTTTSSLKITKCYNAAGPIAGASISSSNPAALQTGGSLTWNTGLTTNTSAGTLTTKTPGVCPAGDTEYTDTGGSVLGSGTNQPLTPAGDVVSASVCINSSNPNSITGTIAPGTYFEL